MKKGFLKTTKGRHAIQRERATASAPTQVRDARAVIEEVMSRLQNSNVVSQESKPFVTQLGPDTTFYGFAGPADDSSEKSSLEQLEAFKSAFERMGVMSDTGASTTPSNITSTPTLFSFPKHSNDLAGPSPIVSGLKYKPNEIIRSCHTIPCKDPRRAKDGWAECLLAKEDTLDVIISTPGFPIALEHPPEVRHRLGQSKLGHLGMFATQDLHFGDLILSERPLLVIECSEKIAASLELPPGIAQNMPLHEIQKASLSYWEHNISKVLDRMDPDRQKAYRSLWNSHLHDGSGPLFGIVRTNCFSISLCDDKKQFMAVLDQMSRINHSCMPNVTVTFDPESFSYRLSALRDLKAGEELFATYLNILSTTAARQEKLKPYGFSCTCKACLDPGSDYLRSRIKRNMIIDLDPLGWTFPPIRGQDYEKTLLDSKQWLKTLEDAGLQEITEYDQHLKNALTACIAIRTKSRELMKPDYMKYVELRTKWVKAVSRKCLASLEDFEELSRPFSILL